MSRKYVEGLGSWAGVSIPEPLVLALGTRYPGHRLTVLLSKFGGDSRGADLAANSPTFEREPGSVVRVRVEHGVAFAAVTNQGRFLKVDLGAEGLGELGQVLKVPVDNLESGQLVALVDRWFAAEPGLAEAVVALREARDLVPQMRKASALGRKLPSRGRRFAGPSVLS